MPQTVMIHLSETAIKEFKRLQAQLPAPQTVVQLTLQPGECAAWVYVLTFREQPQKGDLLFQHGELRVAIPSDTLPLLTGMTIDYSEDLMGGSFRFVNPNAQYTCGCGHAFSLEPVAAPPSDTHCTALLQPPMSSN